MADTVSAIKKPFAKLNEFGKAYGIPIIAGVSGFVAGDVFRLKPLIASRIGARQVSVVGFDFDVTAWTAIFIYAAIAFAAATGLRGIANGALARAVFAFFAGSIVKQLVEMFGITQDIVVVS